MAGCIGMHSFAPHLGFGNQYTQGDCWLNVDGKKKGENWGEREKQRERKEEIPAAVLLGLLRQKPAEGG